MANAFDRFDAQRSRASEPTGNPFDAFDEVAETETSDQYGPSQSSNAGRSFPKPDRTSGMGLQSPENYDSFVEATGKSLDNVPERLQQSFGGLVQMLGEDMGQDREQFMQQSAGRLGITPQEYKLLAWAGNEGLVDPEAPIPDALESLKSRMLTELSPEQQAQVADMGLINPETIAAKGRELRTDAQSTMEPVNAEPGSPEYYASAAIGSIAEMTPALIASALTRNPAVGMTIIGGQVGGESYGTARDEGLSVDESQRYAFAQAAAEAIPEYLPISRILKPGANFFKKMFDTAIAESLQEGVTAALQAGIDKDTIRPDMTWGEARGLISDSMIIGGIAGPGMAAITEPLVRYRNRQSPEGQDPEAAPPVLTETPTQPAPDADVSATGLDVTPSEANPFDVFDRQPSAAEAAAEVGAGDGQPVGRNLQASEPVSEPQSQEQPESPEPALIEQGTGVFRVPVDQIKVDPEQYQFRSRVNEQGVDKRLEGVKRWDDKRAGSVLLHRREDGSMFVADGHHRVDLARRLNQGEINATVIDEADGVSVEQARVEAAMNNIADGKAEPLDVAKVFRDSEVPANEVRDIFNLPSSQVVRDGESLSRLSDNVFGMVAAGQVTEKDGAAIGSAFSEQNQQEAAADAFQKVRPETEYQRQLLVNEIRAADFAQSQGDQGGLFGDDAQEISLMQDRLKVLDALRQRLNGDKRLFKSLNDNADRAGEVGNQIATEANDTITKQSARSLDLIGRVTTTPALNDMVNRAARRVYDGENRSDVVRDLKRELLSYEAGTTEQGSRRPDPAPSSRENAEPGQEPGSSESVSQPDTAGANQSGQPEGQQELESPPPAPEQPTQDEAPADAGVSRSGLQEMPETVPIALGMLRVKPLSGTMYREASPESVGDLIREAFSNSPEQGAVKDMFVTDDRSLALGQGRNRGALIEFDGRFLSGQENQKPGTGVIGGREYSVDYVNVNAIRRFTLPKGARLQGAARVFASQNFDRQKLEDGSTAYTRKGLTDVPALELESQTEEALADQTRQQQEARETEARQKREEEQRAEADDQVGGFTLTGSDRSADVAMAAGQDDMFVSTPASRKVEQAATDTDTSPTDGQKEAGNYKKGRVRIQGLDIAIENPKGSTRSGTDPDGNRWESTMAHHYGYILSFNAAPREELVEGRVAYADDFRRAIYANAGIEQGLNPSDIVSVLESRIRKLNSAMNKNSPNGVFTDPNRARDRGYADALASHIGSQLNIPSDLRNSPSINAALLESANNSMAADTYLFGDLGAAQALRSEGFDSLDVEVKAMVQRHVIRALKNREVFRSVIQLVPIDVMNMLTGRKFSPQEILGNQSVIIKALSADLGSSVAAGRFIDNLATRHPIAFAAPVAEEILNAPAQSLGTPVDSGTTIGAVDERHGGNSSENKRNYNTEGADGDKLDVFIGPYPEIDQVFVIDQQNKDGSFDEHKILIGFANEAEARQGYLANYEDGWKVGPITRMSTDEFKAWIKDGDTTKPLAESKPDQESEAAETAAAQQSEPESPETTQEAPGQPIEDFGEKIEGARKDYASKLAEAKDRDVSAVPLSQSWPEPKYQKMLDEGAPAETVALVRALRDEVPTKPQKGWKLKGWVEMVTGLRDLASTLMENHNAANKVVEQIWAMQSSNRTAREAKHVLGRMELYLEFGHEDSFKGITFGESFYQMYMGEKNVAIWEVERLSKATAFGNMPRTLATGKTREEALENLRKALDKLPESTKEGKAVRFNIYRDRYSNDVFIGKKIGKDVVRMRTFDDDVKAARKYLEENQQELEAELERMKKIPAHRRKSNSPRVGTDHRNGGDVTPDAFAETFGFRGVQFGNYVEQGRRQADLNEAYDALMDLAGIIDVPAKALSLNGELGLAFGARGKGGKNAPMAHYEPGTVVINLTKKSGAGSLAHEWFHSLDNYFGRSRGGKSADRFATRGEPDTAVRPEVVEAFRNVKQTVNRIRMKERSRSLDKMRTKPYWSTDIEMTARAFESYVIERLKDQGASNDYLANIVSEDYWKASEALGMQDSGSYPYPEAAEIPDVRAAYDNLFQVIETRETENGSVEMYSRDGEFRRTPEYQRDTLTIEQAESIRDELMNGWKGAPDVIVRDQIDQFPPGLQAAIRVAGAENDMRGVFWNDTVYILASRIPDRMRMEQVILHEVVGHYGLRKMLGKKMERVLDQIWLTHGGQTRANFIIERYYPGNTFDVNNKEHRHTVSEELIAHLAEQNRGQTLVQRAVAIIREGLRKLGFTLEFTVDDIVNLLRKARETVENGGFETDTRTEGAAVAASKYSKPGEADINFSRGGQSSIKAFQEWFGGSKVVDENGEPLVVYHGTGWDVTAFDKSTIGEETDFGIFGQGFYAISDPDLAGFYANRSGRKVASGPNIMPLYIKAESPLIIKEAGRGTKTSFERIEHLVAAFKAEYPDADPRMYPILDREGLADDFIQGDDRSISEQVNDILQDFEFDSVIYQFDDGTKEVVVFEPTQIKSATGNTGTFDPANPDIRFSRSDVPDLDPQPFGPPSDTLIRRLVSKIADKHTVLKGVQKNIQDQFGEIPDPANAYRAEELFHGKVENDVRLIQENMVEPLAKEMSENDVSLKQLDEFLYALHAPERNRVIAERNPKIPEGGSGMTDAEAAAIIAKIEKEGKLKQYQALAKRVHDMLAMRRKILKSAGLLDEDTVGAWEASYKNYVPLKGWAADEQQSDMPRIGKGFAIAGKESQMAAGRTSKAASPLANTISDLSEAVLRRRKNEVGQSFMNLVQAYPNDNYWRIYTDENPEVERKAVRVKDPATGKMKVEVREQTVPMAMMSDRYFTTKVDGKTHYIKIEDQRLMNAMRNIGPDNSNLLIRSLAAVTRIMSSLNTSYNPEFVISNFSRDIQTALLNLTSEQSSEDGKARGKKIAAKTLKDVGTSIRAINASLKGKKLTGKAGEWQAHFDQFRADGAKTGWFDMKDIDGQMKDLEKMIAVAGGGATNTLRRAFKATTDWVENTNSAIENGVRLSAYVNAIEAGIPRSQAASLAKNMTVNFNRKGELGTMMNALYMFANASVQGTANFVRTLGRLNGVKGDPMWRRMHTAQKIAVGMAVGGFALSMLNRLVAGEDDDEVNWWDKVPDYIKERNIVIMKSLVGGEPGEYWTIPLPYGYNIFPVIGTSMEHMAFSDKSAGDITGNVVLAALGSFSPIGFEESQEAYGVIAKNIMPTILRPVASISLNENFMGGPIFKENFPFGTQKPDSALYFRSTPEAFKELAEGLNEASGGSEFRSGAVDLSPDVMQFLVGYYGGGAYDFFTSRTPNAVVKAATGVEMEDREIPFVRKLTGNVLPYEDQSIFYDRRNEIQQLVSERENLKGRERIEFIKDYRSKLRLQGVMKSTEDRLKMLRKQRDRIEAMDLSAAEEDEKLQRVEKQMKRAIDQFNKRYNKSED